MSRVVLLGSTWQAIMRLLYILLVLRTLISLGRSASWAKHLVLIHERAGKHFAASRALLFSMLALLGVRVEFQ